MPIKQISERFVEEAFKNDIEKEYKDLEISSSLGGNIKFSYEATVNWGSFDVKGLVDKLAMLAEKMSGRKLYDFQAEFQKRIFESVLLNDGEEITALFSRQSGKTETVAHSAVTLLVWIPILARIFPEQLGIYKRGFRIGLFAPTNEQAYTTHSRMDEHLSGETADMMMSDSDINAKKQYRDGMLSVLGPEELMPSGRKYPQFHSFCKLQSAAKQTKIESKTYDLILIDESQEVDSQKIQKSIRPMGSSTNSTIVMTGTAIAQICDLYNAITRNKRKQTQMKIKNHFEFNWKYCAKFNPRYKSFVKKEIERLGEDSDAFRMSYNLEWLLEKGMAITPQMFEEYLKSPSDKFEYFADPDFTYVAGLDLAKESDSTVLTIAKIEKDNIVEKVDEDGESELVEKYLKQIVNWIEMRKDNWESQIDVIVETVETYKIQILAIDSSIDGDCKLYWKENSELKYGTMRELHGRFELGKEIEVLSLIDKANKKMRTISNTGYPSIKNAGIDWNKISASYNHGFQDVYEVELNNGIKVVATNSHSFFESVGYKSSLKLAHLKDAESLIAISKPIDGEKTSESMKFIEFLGLWVADGSFTKGQANQFAISTGNDSKIIDFIKKINPKFKAYGGKGDFTTYDKEMKDRMLKFGIKNEWRSHTKRIPEKLFTASEEEICSFIRGYFSGDGCVYINRESVIIQSSSVNRELSSDIQILLSRLGIRSVIGKGTKNKLSENLQYPLTIQWVESVKLFKEKIGFINKDIPEIKESKRKKQKNELQRIGIRKITFLGKKEVYDLSVPNTESFVVENMLCHNTGVGDPIVDRLEKTFAEKEIKCSIFPVTYTLKEKHNMATLFYEEMRNHRIKVPCHQMAKKTKRFQNFLDQFYTCEKVYKGSYMQLKHSEKIKDAHDDYVNSLLLLCYGVEQNIFPKIKAEKNIFFNKYGKKSAHSQRYNEAMVRFKRQYSANFRRTH